MQDVSVFNAHPSARLRKQAIERYVRGVVGRRRCCVTVIFVGSRFCKAINKKYLNHNYVTDVLSFVIETEPVLEGEVYVNVDRARQQAREYAVPPAQEIARLVIHGTLHLIGYDDQDERARKRMTAAEERHLRRWFSPTAKNTK